LTKCIHAGPLVDSLGRGPGLRNHVVYWLPPPPLDVDVDYIGRSRALDTRCEDHTAYRRNNLETLNLPPLTEEWARDVEEALIAHFGLGGFVPEPANQGSGKGFGQLSNLRHEIDRRSLSYCDRLLVGQYLLDASPNPRAFPPGTYRPYADAWYTKNKPCPGIAGPR
jgi:hypothetical protein